MTAEMAEEEWWRRRELNPRPKVSLAESLHTYSRSRVPLKGHFRASRSEHDKKRESLAQDLVSALGPHAETSLLCDALTTARRRSRGERQLN